jgi:polar amino acid transport system permease protein
MADQPLRKRKNSDLEFANEDVREQYEASRHRASVGDLLFRLPYWAALIGAGWLLILFAIRDNENYSSIFIQLQEGISMTLRIAIFGYLLALIIGLTMGLIRSYPPKPAKGITGTILSFLHLIIYNLATMYVELMRGLPILIVLLVGAFIIFPPIRDQFLEPLFGQEWVRANTAAGSPVPAIVGLGMAYGAFTSETIRAGIQSIERGQMEAARSLGMTFFQAMRLIILPQAIRRVLPSLGNDAIAMIKDSSLASILGIREITQIARVSSGRSFRYVETYLTVAFMYLTLTLIGSFMVRALERTLKQQTSTPNRLSELWGRVGRFGRSFR